jgi:hypothetical protein
MTICGEKLYILSRSGDERAKDAHNVNLSLSMKLKLQRAGILAPVSSGAVSCPARGSFFVLSLYRR